MANGKYETALMTFIPSNPKDWSLSDVELISTASEVDRLTDRIVQDSRSMARSFETFAREVALRNEGWDPTGYSTIRDIAVNSAKLEVEKTNLISLVRLILGRDAAKDFVSEVAKLSTTDNQG